MKKHIQLDDEYIGDLFKQISLLMHSGIISSDSLRIISERETDREIKKLLSDIADEIDSGVKFSEAFENTGIFQSHITGFLRMGEETGNLEETLDSLSDYYHNKDRRKKRLTDALTYPCILLLLLIVIIIILLTQVLPVFSDVYASLGGTVSGIASGLMSFGNILNEALPYIGIAVGILLIICTLILLIPSFRKYFRNLFIKIFGDSGIYRKMNNASFIQAISVAFRSGFSLEEGAALARQIFKDNYKAGKRAEKCVSLIESGEDLDEALKESGFLSSSTAYMLKLSLRAGNGDETISDISEQMTEEAEYAINEMLSRIEPSLVIVTSLITGAILLTVMLPLINIMKTIG
ncbi:MAG: hypothetical protein E7477_01095 [Ruminococcaceae bacterium]|nr:hypothetical protein [Oscillospiraceae bacterium]